MPPLISYLPNILSCLRIMLALLLPFSPQDYWLMLIIGAAFSDFLDGWIARKWQVMSWQGAVLDAFADKFFMLIALITVATSGIFALAWLPAILARDLLVLLTVIYTALHAAWESFRQVKPRLSGKLTTACQFLLLATALLLPHFIYWILTLTILVSTFSALDYGSLFYQQVLHNKQPNH